ncbi:glycosyltransferase 87 family protein [Clostridium autoethanogenum]|uniref:Glycosyltransferase family 39 protein n=1 Tax=Clostridium autoethanogenum DSM 10061 TaxID=1341692 RepID=A0ABM5NW64_9CLOT|nr:glycosyltransferase 87 family protein [Clostridium autoethanogenum]AGY76733.1 glycosyltransferase family 39 protein [Clostridium autoethanogenum DSM 10061]ALU36887.1 Dolichyl-phosphate-mannose-protein mannosyltransferase family [Clostridium autoethanogenum DSM 10061]OVY50423.1 GPI transamidase subunit PIG-U [Clostridium autoethanogenum]
MMTIFLKKNLFKIGLIFLILLSAFFCIYSIKNYKANTIISKNNIQQFNNNKSNKNIPVPKDNAKFSNGTRYNQKNNIQNQPGNSMHFGKENSKRSRNGTHQIPGGDMRGDFSSTKSKYAPFLTLYLIAFLILCAGTFYFITRRDLKINKDNIKILIFSLLCIGLFLRISLSTVMEGYGGDINLFKDWASTAANSFSQFYTNARSSDYPPLYMYVLFLIGKISSISLINPYYTLLLKLPSIIADVVTAYFIYKIAKKYLSLEFSILLSAFYIFNPVTFIDSALWGQVDSFFTLIIVLSLFLLSEGKTILSSIAFTCAVLMKPQGIIFLPVLLFELVRERNLKTFVKSIVSGLITALVIILPFSYSQNALWIFKLYSKTISEYPYASVNGFNFFNLIGANYKKNSEVFFIFNYQIWGMIAITAITLSCWYLYAKNKNKAFVFAAALVQISGVFTFSTGMHERYLFPAAALSVISFVYLKDKRLLALAVGYTITIYTNIYYILFGSSRGMNSDSHSLITDGISLLNIILFIYLMKILIDNMKLVHNARCTFHNC